LLLAGRALQGASFGLFPLAIGILRDEYPAQKLTSAMSITSSTLGFGGGLALVATGVLTSNNGDYHRIFWLSVAVSLLAFVVAFVVLPSRPGPGGRTDFLGAAVLGTGLVLLLLPLAQGRLWGWTSIATIGSFVASAVTLVGFLLLQRRTFAPLVAPALLARRGVAVTNVAALAVGFAMFCAFLGISYFVQIPTVAGYGFTASVLATSTVYLLPGTVVSVLVGPVAGRWVVRFGPRNVLAAAGLIGAIGFGTVAVLHTATWQVIVAGTIVNLAVAMAYATLPALIVMNVSPAETGIANSINSIFRSVGSSIGSAIVVTILASSVNSVGAPSESAFVTIFVLGAIGFGVVLLTVLFGLPGTSRRLTALQAEAEIALAEGAEFAGASAAL
jgi:MFS family permease